MLSIRKIALCFALLALAVVAEAKPDSRDSITIFGRVLCEGKPLADVPVSDGVHIVKTDSLGRYNIASHKWQNTVFVITPSGYEPSCSKRIMPQFWATLRKKREVAEQHDFHLVKRDQRNHRVLFLSNLAFQNSHDDLMQFKNRTIPMVREVIKEAGDSTAVYSFIMAELSNNSSWYSSDFDVDDAVSLMATLRYPTMFYTVMGDQDHDGAVPGTGLTDYNSERHYVFSCGPKYFSTNIGDVHYVVLDNTVFRNEPGKGRYPAEIVGRRNYDRFVTSDQLDWLRKDLSIVKDKNKPVVVCMHQATIYSNGRRTSKRYTKPEFVDSLVNCFAGFKNVHFVTTSSNSRALYYPKEWPHIVEHTLAPTSGDRWRLGYNGFESISSDGVPAGIEIFDIKGDSISWHYRSEKNNRKCFRVYDMAEVGKYYNDNLDVQNLLREYPNHFANYGSKEFGKMVYINWWGYEKNAKLEVFEDNQPMRVRSIRQADPQYISTSPAQTFKTSRRKPQFGRSVCPHLYRVERTSPTSVIRVRATTPFGEIFEESFVGNKPCSPIKK